MRNGADRRNEQVENTDPALALEGLLDSLAPAVKAPSISARMGSPVFLICLTRAIAAFPRFLLSYSV